MRGGSKALAAVVALLLAIAFAACGDDSGDTTSATSPAPAPAAEEEQGGSAEGGSASNGGGDAEKPARGGEASIEDFGSEASGDDRSSLEGAFRGYLNAIAEKDYGTACSYLASSVQQSLQQLVPKAAKVEGCAGILSKLLAPSAGAIAREQANGEITKVRVEGDQAFIVFHAPGAKLYQMTMVQEDGEWKTATVAAAVLVPEL